MKRAPNAVALLFVGALLVLGLLLSLLPSGGRDTPASVRSVEPSGRRALYLVLDELGFETRAWTRSPGHLPRGEHLLVLPAVPETPPGYTPEEETGEEDPGELTPKNTRRLRDPLHYLRFVEEGGTLLCFAEEDMLAFLTDTLGVEALRRVETTFQIWASADEEDVVVLRSGERLRSTWGPTERFPVPRVGSPLEAVLACPVGQSLGLGVQIGRGRVVLLAPEDDFLANESIEDADNALLFVRLAEELAPHGRVLFDEYALGGWVPDSPLALAFAPGTFDLSLHLVLWGLLALWMMAWVREFPRAESTWGRVSPLARAQGFAGTIAGAGRWDLLGRMLQTGVLRRMARRVGLRRELDPTSASPRIDEGELTQVLSSLVPDDARRERIRRLLTQRGIRGAEELEDLGRKLLGLEREFLVTEGDHGD